MLKIIPLFISHEGCPFECIFCNQKKISGRNSTDVDGLKNVIDESIKTKKYETKFEIAFYGGSFTGINIKQQVDYLKLANKYLKNNMVNGIRVSTRPDYIDDKKVKLLKEYNVNHVELGVQSLDKYVLEKSKRGHTEEDVYNAHKILEKNNINVGIQTMVGLPGDDEQKTIETAKKVINLNPYTIRIYPTLVIKGTYLEKMFNNGDYKPFSIERAINICSELLKLYKSKNLNVIRIGLQANENLVFEKDLIAGPYHPSFRQLVESRIWLDKINDEMKIIAGKFDKITIYVPKRKESDVIGNKKENIRIIEMKYKLKKVKIKALDKLKDTIKIEKS